MSTQPFPLRRQIEIDEYFRDNRESLQIGHIDSIIFPNIPTLLPRDIYSIRLSNIRSPSNYLATSLASLALFDSLINILLNIESLNESNTYEVTMYEMGERMKVSINDKIITLKEANNTLSPFFLRSKGYDVWAYFFEKAYAQSVGLYSSIRLGNVFESIYNFVGGEYEVYWIMEDREDTIWLFLLNNLIKTPKKSGSQDIPGRKDTNKDAIPDEKPEEKKKHVQEYITNDIDEIRKIITVSNNVWNHDQNYKHDKEFDGQFFSYVL
jgi:hypothetical protein